VIKGIASNISRGQQEKTLDELYGQYAAAQQAEREQAAQAAEAARVQKLEDERAVREQEAQIARETARLADERNNAAAMARTQAQIAAQQGARQPTRAEQINQVLATTEPGSPERRQGLQVVGADSMVADMDAQALAAEQAEKQAQARANTRSEIEWLLDPAQQRAAEASSGPIDSRVRQLSQKAEIYTQNFEALKSSLTLDKLAEMKSSGALSGSISDADLALIATAAARGLDRSNQPGTNNRILRDIYASLDGDVEALERIRSSQSTDGNWVDKLQSGISGFFGGSDGGSPGVIDYSELRD
jgi:hypothetical protein